jgi:hypothetical protein
LNAYTLDLRTDVASVPPVHGEQRVEGRTGAMALRAMTGDQEMREWTIPLGKQIRANMEMPKPSRRQRQDG